MNCLDVSPLVVWLTKDCFSFEHTLTMKVKTRGPCPGPGPPGSGLLCWLGQCQFSQDGRPSDTRDTIYRERIIYSPYTLLPLDQITKPSTVSVYCSASVCLSRCLCVEEKSEIIIWVWKVIGQLSGGRRMGRGGGGAILSGWSLWVYFAIKWGPLGVSPAVPAML